MAFEFNKISKLLVGKKPPEEIIVIAKLKELNDRISKIFNIIKIPSVKKIYKINILIDCFKVSDVLKDKRLVKGFFKLMSKISIKSIIENKKYKPPIHCEEDRQIIKLSSRCLMSSKIENPVDVNPETASK